MPFVRIDLVQGQTADFRRGIGDVVYDALLSSLGVPQNDRFQVITEHPPNDLIADPTYLGVQRSPEHVIIIQITMNAGRTVDQKKALYKAIADGLHARLGVRREDVVIQLVEVQRENWSFGNGEAQYAPPPPTN